MTMRSLSEWQLKYYPAAALFTLVIVFVACMISGSGAQILSGRLGGDFPAFYGAGRILLDGDIDRLYDSDRQQEAQVNVYNVNNTFLCFAYPPFVALPYAVLAFFPYRIAYIINTLLMLYALHIALSILFDKFDLPHKYYLLIFTLSLFFYPILMALFGGQNTLLSLLLISLVWRYVDIKRETLAGVFLGFLLFKPQFALPIMGLMLLSRRWVVFGSSLMTGFALYIVCVLMFDGNWFSEWLKFAMWFSEIDAEVNAANAISWVGVLVNVTAVGKAVVSYGGYFLSFLNVLWLSALWIDKKNSVSSLMPITCLSLTLIPSHVMYYDSGLIIIACLSIYKYLGKKGVALVLIIWLCSYTQIFVPSIGFSPIFLLNVFCLLISTYIFFVFRKSEKYQCRYSGFKI